jgi:hypothetical protein
MITAFRSKLTYTLVVVAILGAAIAVGSARAAMVDTDSVSLGSGDFKFRNGDLDWYYNSGQIYARLRGDLKLDNANGSCARMRMEYFNDSESLIVKYGGTVCADDGKSDSWDVDLDPWADPRIDLIKVSLQKKTGANGWEIVESAYFKPTLGTDKVRLPGDGVDFGGDIVVGDGPIDSGTVEWIQGEDMDITPHVTGYLHINTRNGYCARIGLTYLNQWGNAFMEKHGDKKCAPDNWPHEWEIDLAPYTSSDIYGVTVALQQQLSDGSWEDVDTWDHPSPGSTKTVYIDAD